MDRKNNLPAPCDDFSSNMMHHKTSCQNARSKINQKSVNVDNVESYTPRLCDKDHSIKPCSRRPLPIGSDTTELPDLHPRISNCGHEKLPVPNQCMGRCQQWSNGRNHKNQDPKSQGANQLMASSQQSSNGHNNYKGKDRQNVLQHSCPMHLMHQEAPLPGFGNHYHHRSQNQPSNSSEKLSRCSDDSSNQGSLPSLSLSSESDNQSERAPESSNQGSLPSLSLSESDGQSSQNAQYQREVEYARRLRHIPQRRVEQRAAYIVEEGIDPGKQYSRSPANSVSSSGQGSLPSLNLSASDDSSEQRNTQDQRMAEYAHHHEHLLQRHVEQRTSNRVEEERAGHLIVTNDIEDYNGMLAYPAGNPDPGTVLQQSCSQSHPGKPSEIYSRSPANSVSYSGEFSYQISLPSLNLSESNDLLSQQKNTQYQRDVEYARHHGLISRRSPANSVSSSGEFSIRGSLPSLNLSESDDSSSQQRNTQDQRKAEYAHHYEHLPQRHVKQRTSNRVEEERARHLIVTNDIEDYNGMLAYPAGNPDPGTVLQQSCSQSHPGKPSEIYSRSPANSVSNSGEFSYQISLPSLNLSESSDQLSQEKNTQYQRDVEHARHHGPQRQMGQRTANNVEEAKAGYLIVSGENDDNHGMAVYPAGNARIGLHQYCSKSKPGKNSQMYSGLSPTSVSCGGKFISQVSQPCLQLFCSAGIASNMNTQYGHEGRQSGCNQHIWQWLMQQKTVYGEQEEKDGGDCALVTHPESDAIRDNSNGRKNASSHTSDMSRDSSLQSFKSIEDLESDYIKNSVEPLEDLRDNVIEDGINDEALSALSLSLEQSKPNNISEKCSIEDLESDYINNSIESLKDLKDDVTDGGINYEALSALCLSSKQSKPSNISREYSCEDRESDYIKKSVEPLEDLRDNVIEGGINHEALSALSLSLEQSKPNNISEKCSTEDRERDYIKISIESLEDLKDEVTDGGINYEALSALCLSSKQSKPSNISREYSCEDRESNYVKNFIESLEDLKDNVIEGGINHEALSARSLSSEQSKPSNISREYSSKDRESNYIKNSIESLKDLKDNVIEDDINHEALSALSLFSQQKKYSRSPSTTSSIREEPLKLSISQYMSGTNVDNSSEVRRSRINYLRNAKELSDLVLNQIQDQRVITPNFEYIYSNDRKVTGNVMEENSTLIESLLKVNSKKPPKTNPNKMARKSQKKKREAPSDVVGLNLDEVISYEVTHPLVRKLLSLQVNKSSEELALLEELDRIPAVVSQLCEAEKSLQKK